MTDFKGKKVLITGSTQGIGLEIAKQFSNCDAVVYINGAVSEEKVNNVVKAVPNSRPALCDLSKPECAETLYKITGDIDVF